jgi:Membrane-bound toxin component of toxin-antitoxin system
MSKGSKTALLLALKPSRRLKKLVIFVHTVALAASMANALTLGIKLSLFALICINGWLTLRRVNADYYTIKYTEALGWELSEGDGFVSIEILKSTVITTQALFLHFKHRSQEQSWKSVHKKTLLVLNDALAEEDYRCLIVKLKTTSIK